MSWRRSLIVLWGANFVTALGMMMILPFFPLFLRDLGETDDRVITLWTGFVVGAAPFSAALMGGIWGALGDQVGRRAMILRALLGIAVFVGLMGFARSPLQLLFLRFGQGFFSGFCAPSLTLVSVLAPKEIQGRISSWLQSAFLAGSVVGPALGGVVATKFGFSIMLWACSALALAAVLTVRLLVPEPPLEPSASPAFRTDVAAAMHSVLSRVARELAGVFASPLLRAVFLAFFLVRLSISAINPTLVLFVERLMGERSDASSHVASLVFTAYPLALLLSLPFWGLAADRRRPGSVLLLCVACGAVLTLLQALAGTPLQLGLLRFAAGAFLAGVFPAGFALIAAASDAAHRGGTTGMAFSALAFGLALGPWMCSVVDGLFGYRALLLACGLLLAAAVLRLGALRARLAGRARPR
ncbi:MAG: MFS transporter [Planctomycetes bacterium]|nr:MFS transporter [Planctomycetota bacterium]